MKKVNMIFSCMVGEQIFPRNAEAEPVHYRNGHIQCILRRKVRKWFIQFNSNISHCINKRAAEYADGCVEYESEARLFALAKWDKTSTHLYSTSLWSIRKKNRTDLISHWASIFINHGGTFNRQKLNACRQKPKYAPSFMQRLRSWGKNMWKFKCLYVRFLHPIGCQGSVPNKRWRDSGHQAQHSVMPSCRLFDMCGYPFPCTSSFTTDMSMCHAFSRQCVHSVRTGTTILGRCCELERSES